jgi:hypothetical protein
MEKADMNATKTLRSARDSGVSVELSGGDLLLAASIEPPAGILDALTRYKLEIIRILAPTDIGPTAEDWLTLFDERAAAAEFDGGQPRELAERQAIGDCILDEAMGETTNRQIERFIRSLPERIGRPRRPRAPTTPKNPADPGEPEISETTP